MSGVQQFLGSWREDEKIGYEEMADALGLPPEKKAFFKNAKTEISYTQDGEFWTITVGMQGVPDNRTFRFKLGDPYDSASLDGSKMKSVMVAEKDTFVEKHTDEGMNVEMHIVRHIENDKMIVVSLPPEKKAFFKNAKTEISYTQDGEFWTITVGMQGVPDNRTFRFKLGDPYDSASLDGSKMKSVMVAEKDTFVENHTDETMNMEMHIVRHIENDKMIVGYCEEIVNKVLFEE